VAGTDDSPSGRQKVTPISRDSRRVVERESGQGRVVEDQALRFASAAGSNSNENLNQKAKEEKETWQSKS
jgi:hypothetical protein